MLVDAATGDAVTHLPRRAAEQLEAALARATPADVAAMEQKINEWADAIGNTQEDFFASNWTTGKDWNEVADGAFQPLYPACNNNFEEAGWMLGWLIRRTMIHRPDDWVMYKDPEAGTDDVPRQLWGTFYWRRDREQ